MIIFERFISAITFTNISHLNDKITSKEAQEFSQDLTS